jgi:uncharacterized protein with von Willebrand factor type A (vWA) domain
LGRWSVTADLADVVARFTALLRVAGLAVDVERSTRFTRAVLLLNPSTADAWYRCALATLVSSPADIEILDRVLLGVTTPVGAGMAAAGGGDVGILPSSAERLAGKDFADLGPDELAQLAEMMRRFRITTPPRPSRRYRPARRGRVVDLRETLRRARRSGAEAVVLRRRTTRRKPRKLVVLCDISGSMEPYARAMLQLLYFAAGGANAEVFTFATRLTRITKALAADPAQLVRKVGEVAPDWSGGTRIGETLGEFLDGHAALARGAVVVVISDGWETGDPKVLDAEMARLSRLAHRIVWANPRTASPRYRPLVGGMAAAWPYCDAVVSAHNLDALPELIAAIRAVHR